MRSLTLSANRCNDSSDDILPSNRLPKGAKAGILKAALRLFATKGFAGASMRDLSQAVGLQPASLYSHYKSKDIILGTLIDIGHSEHLAQMEQALADADDDYCSQLSAYVQANTRFHGDYALLATVINLELHALSDEFMAAALAARARSIQLVMEIITQGSEQGVFNIAHDPRLATSAVCAISLGISQWYNAEDGHNLDNIALANSDFALRLVGAA